MLNYQYIECKYGSAVAYQCLVEIEHAAKIAANTDLSFEERLKEAIRAQDAMRLAA